MNYITSKTVDDLGRVVLPANIRRRFCLDAGAVIDIYTEGTSLVIKASDKNCFSCGGRQDLTAVNGVGLCKTCLLKFNEHEAQ